VVDPVAMTDFDPLDDIFGTSKPANSQSAAGKGAMLQEMNLENWNPNFDADFDASRPTCEPLDEEAESPQDLPLVGGSTSHNYRPVNSGGWGHSVGVEKVGEDELRRRIKGVGSENEGVLPRVQQALADAYRCLCCGGRDPNLMDPPGVCGFATAMAREGCSRVHERYVSAPRTFMLAVLVICVAFAGSVSYYRSGSVMPFSVTIFDKRIRGVAAEDESTQASAGDSTGSETGDGASKDMEDSREASKDSEDSRDAKGDSAAARSSPGTKLTVGTREFAALRRSVTDGDRAIQEELKALRQEVARLGRLQRKDSSAAGGGSEAAADVAGATRDSEQDTAGDARDAEEDVSERPRPRSRFGSVRREVRGDSPSKISEAKLSKRTSSSGMDAASDTPAPAYKRGNRNPSDAVYR